MRKSYTYENYTTSYDISNKKVDISWREPSNLNKVHRNNCQVDHGEVLISVDLIRIVKRNRQKGGSKLRWTIKKDNNFHAPFRVDWSTSTSREVFKKFRGLSK